MKANQKCDLASCFLCKNSLAGWLSSIESNKKNLQIRKGQTVFNEGEQVKGIYFLYEGKVKVHKQWGEEKELILKFAQKGDMIGYRGLGSEKIYPVSATALEAAIVCFVELTFFEDMLKVNHELTYRLMKFYANELQDAEKRIRDLAHMTVKGRLADTLLHLKKQFSQNKEGILNIHLRRQDIASYAGTTYETLFRTMNELTKEKIIKVSGKNIMILNESRLKELVSDKSK